MIVKWNKSVILTYIGLSLSILGIALIALKVELKYAMICFIFAGVCDMFDGTVARRCKRTKEEKAFGIELDSLVDVFSFIAFPLVILGAINKTIYFLPIAILYAIFGIARLAHFNIATANLNKAVDYYEGLPVTFSAMILPLSYVLSYILKENTFIILYNMITLLIAILFICRIKVPKPKLTTSLLLLLIAFVTTGIFLFV